MDALFDSVTLPEVEVRETALAEIVFDRFRSPDVDRLTVPLLAVK